MQTGFGKAGGAGEMYLTAHQFLVQHPAEQVDFMDDDVGNLYRVCEAGSNARGTADAMRHNRRTQLAGFENFLHLAVIRVKAAHKADLYECFARFFFRFYDFLAVLDGGCERLFAEYWLAGCDAFQR